MWNRRKLGCLVRLETSRSGAVCRSENRGLMTRWKQMGSGEDLVSVLLRSGGGGVLMRETGLALQEAGLQGLVQEMLHTPYAGIEPQFPDHLASLAHGGTRGASILVYPQATLTAMA